MDKPRVAPAAARHGAGTGQPAPPGSRLGLLFLAVLVDLIGFWFLLFTRLLPPVAIAEMKEVVPPPRRGKGAS